MSEPTPLTSNRPWASKGRLLGVDYGTVRIGLAVCDPDRIIASPLATYARQSEAADLAYFTQLVTSERLVGLVVGLPLHLSGDESEKSREARAFGAKLAAATGLPVTYWDERFTSSVAEDALLGAGLTKQKRKARIDRVAAQVILQCYLEAGCPAPIE